MRQTRHQSGRGLKNRFVLEPLEPRILFNADVLIDGLSGAVEGGLVNSSDKLLGVVFTDTEFSTPIPGVLQSTHDVNGVSQDDGPNGELDDKDLHAPDVRDVLTVNVDRNLNQSLPAIGAVSSLRSRYNYIENLPLSGDMLEQALRAMELNSTTAEGALVDIRETYKVLVVGAISDFFAEYDHTADENDTVGELEGHFSTYLSNLTEPWFLSSLFNVDLTSISNNSDSDTFAYSFNIDLTVKDQFLIDLGLEADKNEILLPERVFTPGEADGSPGPGLSDVPAGTRSVELQGRVVIPFSFELDISSPPVSSNDFTFSVPSDITVAVDDNVAGVGGESLQNLIANVGFLGTQVPGPAADSKFNLHMDWTISVTDPSSLANLGFTQSLPATSSTGVLIAATPLPNDPGDPYVFPQDVIFSLKIGQQTDPAPVTVTIDADTTTGNSTAEELRANVQTALDDVGLSLVKAKLSGSTLKLVLDDADVAALDITPLGFTSNQLFDGASPYELAAPNAPSILGATTPTTVKFLLSVGGVIPKLVTVTTTPADDDPDGNPGSGDEGQLALAGLLADINTALSAAGLGSVSASDTGTGKVKLSHGSSSLEVTRQLQLDAKNQITSEEVNDPSFTEFLDVAKDQSDDKLQITMPLDVRDGVDFTPSGNPGIKVEVDPFTFSNSDLKLDSAKVKRLTLPLKALDGTYALADSTPGHSDFVQYLDFNVVGPGEAISMIQQLETWLRNFRDTDMLGHFNIPFAESVLGRLLTFEDLLHDTLLIDDQDTADDTDDDVGKLLAKGLDPDNADAFITSFGTAQELGARLDNLVDPSLLTKTASGGYADYDETSRQLTYRLGLTHLFGADNVASDFTSNLNLTPVVSIATESKIHLEAVGHFDAILGIEMGPGKIDTSTLLADLNGGIGAGIETAIALTGAGDVRIIEGRLSADAAFDVSVTTGSGTTLARVTVTKGSTAENTQLGHLVTDINTALENAALLPLPPSPTPPTIVNIHDRLQATSEFGRIVLKAVEGAGVQHYSVNSSTASTAYTELGLPTTVATTVSLSVQPASVKVSADVDLNFYKNGELTATTITLKSGTTGTAATGGNVTLTDLVNDLNAALAGTSLNGQIAAARSGNNLVLAGIDSSIKSFRVEGSGAAKSEIGFASAQTAATFLVAPNDVNAQNPTNVFGKLTGAANFSIKLNSGAFKPIAVSAAATNDNSSLADLLANIDAAIAGDADLSGKVEAFQAANLRIGFRAIDASVLSFEVKALGADPAVTQMGLFDGTQLADAGLRVGAIKAAPFYLGPAADATFTLTVTGGSSAGAKTVTLQKSETLTNSTIQELVGDLRRALDQAYAGAANNPLLVSNDGNRILFKPKSTGAGVGVTQFTIAADASNAAITDLKLYRAGTSTAGPTVTSASDQADLLIYTKSGQVYRVVLDGKTDIGGVLTTINSLTPQGTDPTPPLTASVNVIGTGLTLKDNTTGTADFKVDSVNGSRAAQALGIFGSDLSFASVNSSNTIDDTVADGQIDGTRLATLQLADRFFLRQVDASTKILRADLTVGAATFDGSSSNVVSAAADTIKIQAHGFVTGDPVVYENGGGTSVGGLSDGATYYVIAVDDNTLKLANSQQNALSNTAVGLSSVGTGASHRLQNLLSLEANFGFVGVTLTGSGAASGTLAVGLVDTDSDAVIRLSDIQEALSKDKDSDQDVDVFDLATLVSFPTLSLSGDLGFGVQITPSLSIVGLGGSPKITFHLNGPGSPFQLKAGAVGPYDVSDLVASNPANANFGDTLPDVDVNSSGLGDLANFEEVSFADVLESLKGLSSFLNQFSAFAFLDEDIPLIGLSFNDLVNVADRFSKAVEEIEQNPAGAVQALEQKVRETFGLPPSSTVFALQLVDDDPANPDGDAKDMLKVSLNLPKTFNQALSVDLDLSDEFPPELPISLLGTAGLNAGGTLNAKLALGIDLDDPANLVLFTHPDDTSITGSLSASADNVTFNASLGPLGVFIAGGNAQLAINVAFMNSGAAANSRVALASAFSAGGFAPTFTGSVDATLPVFFPSQSTFVGDIGFNATLALSGSDLIVGGTGLTIPDDILNLDFENFNLLGNLPLLIDAGDLFLSGIQDVLDGDVFGFKLPLIGDKLSDGARFIETFRKDFVQPFRDLVESAPEKTEALVQQYLYDVIQPTGLLKKADGVTPADSPNDIVITGDPFGVKTPGDPSDDDFVQFNFVLGQTFSPEINLNFDLGFPGLSLKADGELGLTLGWNLGVGFGISVEEGAYIDIARNNDANASDLNVFVDANIGDTTLTGTLGFLQLVIAPRNDDFDGQGPEYATDGQGPIYGGNASNDPTKFHAEFGVNIVNGGENSDKHLSYFELGNLSAKISALADAEVNLNVTAQLDPSLLPDTISAALPKVKTQFVLDWELSSTDLIATGIDLGNGLKLVEFRDVGIDLGSFLSETVGPIVAKIQEITGPLEPIVDIVTARIPVLSDLAGRTITLADIAAAFGEFDPGLIYAIADIISLVNSIQTGGGTSLFLTLGDFKLVDAANPTQSLLGGGGGGLLSDPNFNFSDDKMDGLGGFDSLLGSIPGLNLTDLTNAANLDSLLNGQGSDPNSATAKTAKSLFGGGFSSTPDDSGFAFPIFQDPSQIFGLLVGRNATLITYDLPPFVMDFKWEVSFPIYGPLWGVVSAGVGMKIDLAFGYDTQGIRDFADGGFQNPLDLISGFYVSDTNLATGEFGVDVPELTFSGNIGVGAELNAGIASAGVTANIILTVNFDLFDPNHDGKVRISELVSTFLFEARNGDPLLAPIAIFDVNGNVAFQLSAYIKFLVARFDFEITPPIVLFEFSIPFDREPILATERGDGSVLLNVGPNAMARQNGDTRDINEEIHVKDAGSGKVAVWSDPFGVPESAAQLYSIGGDNPVVVAFGGEGNDVLDAGGLSSYAAELAGESGDDVLIGGTNADQVSGGVGDDKLFGERTQAAIDALTALSISTGAAVSSGGKDTITGGEGNDFIDGGPNDDIIFGDTGAVSGGDTGSIRSSIGLKDGDDTVLGGTGQDFIFGGGGADSLGGDVDPSMLDGGGASDDDFLFGDGGRIEAPNGVPDLTRVTNADGTVTYTKISLTTRSGGGNDTIRGHGGKDVVFGGTGNDDIDGGAQDDTLFGETGFDLVSGGGDADTIMGGTEDDRVFGFRNEAYPGAPDGGDIIFGQEGNDFIRGNKGNDYIEGNAGADIIFGDYDEDEIYGQNEPDLIFGGPGRDYIEGGTSNDIVFGDDGIVAWVDFYGAGAHKVIGLVGTTADVQNLNDAALTAIPHTDDILTTDDGQVRTMDLILSEVNGTTDGNDTAIGGEGDDIILGGADALHNGKKGDTLFGDLDPAQSLSGPVPAGEDILIGDGGRLQFHSRRRDNIRTIIGANPSEVGADNLSGNGGEDVLFGCGDGDTLYGRMDSSTFSGPNEDALVSDDDIIVGDDGEIDYGAGTGIIQKIFTYPSLAAIAVGGVDHAFGNKGDDIIFGGIAGDFLKGDNGEDGDDIIFGDNGEIDFGLDDDGVTTQITQLFTTDTSEASGGIDTIAGEEDKDIILGGVAGDFISGNDGADIVLGDNGELKFNVEADLDTLDLIRSFRDGLGGVDVISGHAGDDVLIGGTAGDTLYGDDATASNGASDGEDVMLGDNADIILIGTVGRLVVRATAIDLITTTDTAENTGGADTMSGNAKADIILGGVNNGGTDTLYGDRAVPTATTIANDGDDILLGDNGQLDFTFGDSDRNVLDLIRSFEDGLGGTDLISGNKGADVAIGGTEGDTIYGDDAAAASAANDLGDMLLGDNADVFLVAPLAAAGGDLKLVLNSAVKTIKTTDEEHPEYGGIDTISGNAQGDIIAGGVKGDTLYGDRATPTTASIANEKHDIVLGDNGSLEWLSNGRFSEITGIDIAAENPALWEKYGAAAADTDLTTLDLITTEQPTSGGRDIIYGDEGNDLVFGGTDSDTIRGDDGDELAAGALPNRDVLFGDFGRLYPQFSTLPDFNSRNFFAIDIGPAAGGEGDRIWGEEGADVMLGQQGDDRMFGGSGDDDMIGGHNVSGAYDELAAPAIVATLNPAVNDLMDGGSGDDAMTGDNAIVWRRADDVNPRFRQLNTAKIYSTTNSAITANVGSIAQSDPDDAVGRDITLIDHSDAVEANPLGRFGADVMAGGADSDVMFGELGNDLMQGDGLLASVPAAPGIVSRTVNVTDSGSNPDTDETLYFNVPEAVTDAEDYLEGSGGDDLIYGGVGQDDLIGGNSALFGLTAETMRPDGSDTIFGGAGTRIARNDVGDSPSLGHSRDADYIMGDNANVFRLVNATDQFLVFAYDNYAGSKIVPRAMQQLDYTLGGADFAGGTYVNGAANADNGAPDLIRGEDGDDVIFGMTGSDVVFGNAQDDDVIGGYGHDWISGGTGQDGVLGDDGLVFTSRNGTAEALYGITATTQETITTPGQIQYAVINVTGELKKSVDLVPFSYDPAWIAIDDEFPDNADSKPNADDIIFGGLGGDFLHGASGDDAISGAEALEHAYVPVYDANGDPTGVLDLGYTVVTIPSPTNPGNVLAFNPEDTDGQHLNNRFRAGEFRLYDEYDPLRKILLENDASLAKDGTGWEFVLNFNKTEGPELPGGTTSGPHGITYPAVNTDGNDAIFGDLGNDWLVGGTGRDNAYGGWGNDLMNMDDDHSTNGALNDQPETHPSYEDRAYGGAGRDVLIANTGGDRLIDWVGEYNTYLVPFAPFGQATVSRTLQPFLPEFLYGLSKADGADQSRPADTGADPLRNGEPDAEMGLVLQKDTAWQDQTGAPSDPQAGNIPGGQRDVLRSADFNNGQSQGFAADSGSWSVTNGRFQVAPAVSGGDAVSVFYVDSFLPSYFEMLATVNAAKPTAGADANGYLVFDYQSPSEFKFAGLNAATNKLEIGHRNAQGWVVDKQASFPGQIKSDTGYNLFLAINGTTATLTVNNQVSLTSTFALRLDAYGFSHGLNDGMVGLGARNAGAQIDNVVVQRIAPLTTLNKTVDFSSGTTSLFQAPLSGTWNVANGRYDATAEAGVPAIDLLALEVAPASLVDLLATFKTSGEGGLVFDQYAVDDFKFVTISVAAKQIILGHRTPRGWFTDAVASYSGLAAETDQTLGIILKGTTVSVTLNSQTQMSHSYNALVTDGAFGLLARNGQSSFDAVTVKTDDPAY